MFGLKGNKQDCTRHDFKNASRLKNLIAVYVWIHPTSMSTGVLHDSPHATVRIGEYTIPLIGVPMASTQEKCDSCKQTFHIQKIKLNEAGKFICEGCQK